MNNGQKRALPVNSVYRQTLQAKKISVYLSLNGYEMVDKPEISDIMILIGCGVTNEFADLSLSLVKKFQIFCISQGSKGAYGLHPAHIFNNRYKNRWMFYNIYLNPHRINFLNAYEFK